MHPRRAVRNSSNMLTIAVDAMGGDHAPKPEVEGAIRAAKTLGVKVVLVGREDVVRRELDSHEDSAHCPSKIHHASEQITMDDSAARSRAHQARQFHARGVAPGARRLRPGIRLGRQHRRRDGHRQDGAGRGAGRGPAGAGGRISHAQRNAGGDGGRGRQRGLLAAHAGAVRRDGRDLLARDSAAREPARRACSRSAKKSTRATS